MAVEELHQRLLLASDPSAMAYSLFAPLEQVVKAYFVSSMALLVREEAHFDLTYFLANSSDSASLLVVTVVFSISKSFLI